MQQPGHQDSFPRPAHLCKDHVEGCNARPQDAEGLRGRAHRGHCRGAQVHGGDQRGLAGPQETGRPSSSAMRSVPGPRLACIAQLRLLQLGPYGGTAWLFINQQHAQALHTVEHGGRHGRTGGWTPTPLRVPRPCPSPSAPSSQPRESTKAAPWGNWRKLHPSLLLSLRQSRLKLAASTADTAPWMGEGKGAGQAARKPFRPLLHPWRGAKIFHIGFHGRRCESGFPATSLGLPQALDYRARGKPEVAAAGGAGAQGGWLPLAERQETEGRRAASRNEMQGPPIWQAQRLDEKRGLRGWRGTAAARWSSKPSPPGG